MEVTPSGITTEVRPEQSWKALLAMVLREEGREMDLMLVQL